MSKAAESKNGRVVVGLALAIAAIGLSGCGSSDENAAYVEQPVESLYNRGLDELSQQEYKAAAKAFEEVDRQHPYSVWATKAQLMAAFAYYESNKYDEAIIALDRFIQLAHEAVGPAEERVGFGGLMRRERQLVQTDRLLQLPLHLLFVGLLEQLPGFALVLFAAVALNEKILYVHMRLLKQVPGYVLGCSICSAY